MTYRKNPAAVALGRRGGQASSRESKLERLQMAAKALKDGWAAAKAEARAQGKPEPGWNEWRKSLKKGE